MKTLIHTSMGPPDYEEMKVYGDDLALEAEKIPPLIPAPAQSPKSEEPAIEEPQPAAEPPPPLEHSCPRCGAFAFIPIDLCDDCLAIKSKRKPRRKRKTAKPPKKTLVRPDVSKFEQLSIRGIELQKIVLNHLRRQCDKLRFGPDAESAADETARLTKLERLQTEYLNLFELIGYNIDLRLDSPKPNIYK